MTGAAAGTGAAPPPPCPVCRVCASPSAWRVLVGHRRGPDGRLRRRRPGGRGGGVGALLRADPVHRRPPGRGVGSGPSHVGDRHRARPRPVPRTAPRHRRRVPVAGGRRRRSRRSPHVVPPAPRGRGRPALYFSGFKVVAPGDVFDVWPSTTTLFVTLRGDGPDGPVLGRGVLRIKPEDFATQLRTMAVTGPVGSVERLDLEARFGRAFAGKLYEDTARSCTAPRASTGTPRRGAGGASPCPRAGHRSTGPTTARSSGSPATRAGRGDRCCCRTAWGRTPSPSRSTPSSPT